jgi:hypothetical protein
MDHAADDSRPLEIVKALCELRWPTRVFRLVDPAPDHEDAAYGLYYLNEFVDTETGERAIDLIRAECGLPPGDGNVRWELAATDPDRTNIAEILNGDPEA